MATNYVQDGKRLLTTNGLGTTLASGGAILVGDTLRIAVADIANGATGECDTEGVAEVPATTADTWSDGAAVYWNNSTKKLTSTAGSNKCVGIAVGAKTNGQTTAKIKLWPFLV